MRTFAAVLGSLEIVAALLIAIRPLAPRISVIGSAMGVLLFLSTLSLLFTTPGVTAASGFPVLSVMPGQFLLKGLVLVSASLWTLGDSLSARVRHPKGLDVKLRGVGCLPRHRARRLPRRSGCRFSGSRAGCRRGGC